MTEKTTPNSSKAGSAEQGSVKRKHEHLEYANDAQMDMTRYRSEFYYEPLFRSHPSSKTSLKSRLFLDKELKAPLWISSMTGGTGAARHINQNLARAAKEFGVGFGLGSCRALLNEAEGVGEDYKDDFALRPVLGEDVPFYANLGLAQLEQLLLDGEFPRIQRMLSELQADGLIIHLNPLQEWFQEGGDRYQRSPLESLDELLELASFPVIVKEVGQGMGPRSLEALIRRPLAAIEFGALGGTNFSLLERQRSRSATEVSVGLSEVGHTAKEMVTHVLAIMEKLKESGHQAQCRQFIVSGGISDPLQGWALVEKLTKNSALPVEAVFGQARAFLSHATGEYEELQSYCQQVMETLTMAEHFLEVK